MLCDFFFFIIYYIEKPTYYTFLKLNIRYITLYNYYSPLDLLFGLKLISTQYFIYYDDPNKIIITY